MPLLRWPLWRRKKRSRPVVYNASNSTLTIQLEKHIGADHFSATPADFATKLRTRESISEQVRLLLAELFCRGAITSCKIEFGTRLILSIATHNSQGHELLAGGRLEQFQATFSDITNQPIVAAWQDDAPTIGAFGVSCGVDGETIAHVIGMAVNSTLEGLKVAAAIKILSS